MADYLTHHPYRAPAPHRADGHLLGWIVAAAAMVMLAALTWVWMQQRTIDSPLPQPVSLAAAPTPASAPVVQTAAPDVSPPASAAVAAAGDTRAVRP